MRKHPAHTALTLVLVLMAVPQRASAYVDPGSGAMIWQMVAAAVVGSGFYLHKLVRKLRSLVQSNRTEENGPVTVSVRSHVSGN